MSKLSAYGVLVFGLILWAMTWLACARMEASREGRWIVGAFGTFAGFALVAGSVFYLTFIGGYEACAVKGGRC